MKKITLPQAFIPVIALIGMLAYNVFVYGDEALSGSNQFILLVGAAVAAIVGFYNKANYEDMMHAVKNNIQETTPALIILLFVGALTGTWLISGVIPTMIYYGLELINPTFFLPLSLIISAIVSISTGSSWTTSATVGIALVGVGSAMGIHEGMVAGAVISGAYFGDKMSPLSDTTNLAPAIAGTDLITHIKYMAYTTVPTITLSLIAFLVIGLSLDVGGEADFEGIRNDITQTFCVTPWLFLVPLAVILLIVFKTKPVIALFIGTLMGGLFALIFQQDMIIKLMEVKSLNFQNGYQAIMDAITVDVAVETPNEKLNDLFSSGGMSGMLGTIWLIICAMIFGGVMEAIGALDRISHFFLSMAKGVFGLFAATVGTCIGLNVTASDQYLAIVVPGKMFKNAYKNKGLAPENLSRTLEDAGTVTSVLVPWNTCGAYQSKVLMGEVGVVSFIPYAFFNILSPFMTLLFALLKIRIKMAKGGYYGDEISTN